MVYWLLLFPQICEQYTIHNYLFKIKGQINGILTWKRDGLGNRPFSRCACQTVYFTSELIKSENAFKAIQSLISDLNWMEEMQE